MGYITAYDTALMVLEGDLSLEEAVRLHLTGNVYPPADELTEAGTYALEKCRKGDWEGLVTLPDGHSMAAIDVVEQLCLTAFLDAFAEEEQQDE